MIMSDTINIRHENSTNDWLLIAYASNGGIGDAIWTEQRIERAW